MPAPADYIPGRADLSRSLGQQPITSHDSGFYAATNVERSNTVGAVGTLFFSGLITGEEYNSDLQGDKAIATYDRMWRSNGQIAAVIRVCVLPLLEAEWSVQPASDDPNDVLVAQFVSDNLLTGMKTSWHGLLQEVLQGMYVYGFSVFEKLWTISPDGMIRLLRLAPRLQRTIYRWFPDPEDDLDRVMQRVFVVGKDGVGGTFEFPVIPATKLAVFTLNQLGNNFQGISLLRHAYTHWYYLNNLYQIDAIACERNGLGVPTWEEPLGVVVQKSDRDAAAAAAASFHAHEKAYIDGPPGWKFTLTGVTGSIRDIMPSIQYHDLLIARSVLAQFINLDSGGTLIAARDSSSFFLQSLHAVAKQVADVINRSVIRELVDLNFNVTRYPMLQVEKLEQRDLEAYLRGVAALVTAGGITMNAETENTIRGQLDFPDLPADATVAGGGTPTVDSGSQGAEAGTASVAEEDKGAKPATEDGGGDAPAELTRQEQAALLKLLSRLEVPAPAAGGFRRELRPLERHVDLRALDHTIDSAKAQVVAELKGVLGPSIKARKLKATQAKLEAVLFDAAVAQYQAGRKQIEAEVKSQRGE